MKKNSGVPKKSPRKRHKKKRLKNRKRLLRQRLARLSAMRLALAATRPSASAGYHSVESEPEKSLPTPTQGKPLWDATMNSIDTPQFFDLQQPRLPPKSPDLVTIRLPGPPVPLMVDPVVYRPPSALRSSMQAPVLSIVQPCIPPPDLTTKPLLLPPAFLSPPLTIVMSRSQPPRLPEQPPEQPHRSQNSPSLPGLPPSAALIRRVGALKVQKPEAMAEVEAIVDRESSADQVPADNRKKSVNYQKISMKYLKKTKIKLSKDTKNFSKKSSFISKAYRPNKRRFVRRSIGFLIEQRPVLSGSRQLKCYATKPHRLSRVSGKTLFPVKLLVPVTKQHSELFTPVAAAELLTRQQVSLGYSPIETPFKPAKPPAITDSAIGEEPLPFDGEEQRVHYKFIVRGPLPATKQLRQYAELFSDKAYFIRKDYQANKLIVGQPDEKTIDLSQHRLTEVQSSNSSAPDGDQMIPVSPAAGPMRRDPSVEHSPAEQPLNFIYPAVIADQLMNEALIFDQAAAKDYFRKIFGLRKTTSGSEWAFREAERLFIHLSECLPELKQACLEECGAVPEELFSAVSTELAQYVKPSLNEEDYVISDLLHEFSEHMADFDQLIQSLAATDPTAPGALEPPAGPPCEVVTTSLLVPHPERDHSFNNDY